MADIGVYRFVFEKSLSREELEKKTEMIERADSIDGELQNGGFADAAPVRKFPRYIMGTFMAIVQRN